jgi:beta-mannosidase
LKTVDLSGLWLAAGTLPQDASREIHSAESHLENFREISEIGSEKRLFAVFFDTRNNRCRTWLKVPATLAGSSVWLDGTYLGDANQDLHDHFFEINSDINDHHHAVMIPPSDTRSPLAPSLQLVETGGVRIARLQMTCADSVDERAVFECKAEFDTISTDIVKVRSIVTCPNGEEVESTFSKSVATGRNRVRWSMTIDTPQLWWPESLGNRPLYDIEVQVLDSHGDVSDVSRIRTGVRTTAVVKDRLWINGVPVPSDLIRNTWEIQPASFYDDADQSGLVIRQGLPKIGWRDRRQPAIERSIRQAIELLAHRPSIGAWMHNRPKLVAVSDPSRSVIKR